jgi:hypothetical protein
MTDLQYAGMTCDQAIFHAIDDMYAEKCCVMAVAGYGNSP